MNGKYINGRGVELEVTDLHYSTNIIGAIWEAHIVDSLFGTRHLLVTPEGLVECGYVKVEELEAAK